MNLSKGQEEVMVADGHLLVVGGPGSGKTTVSILKAAQIIKTHLRPGQRVLFLSFARATISRVIEAIEYEQNIPPAQKSRINVETYHSFFWRIIKTHGYLIGLPRHLSILTPPEEAIALSQVRSCFPARNLTDAQKTQKKLAEDAERERLAHDEGRVGFDLYAEYVAKLLHGSSRVRSLIGSMYPVMILDEFQDTNDAQWSVVQALGACCKLIALADPEQRIYDWIGADPARLDHFKDAFRVSDFDLGTDNYRSAGTEIALFGNDVLTGKFRQSSYKGISICCFEPFQAPAMSLLVTTIHAARKRLVDARIMNWSLAILVPTKKMTRRISDALRQPPAGINAIAHSAVIEIEAAFLGAEVIGLLMQPAGTPRRFALFIDLLCNYFQGKGGSEPTRQALAVATNIRKAYEKLLAAEADGKTIRKNSMLHNIIAVYEQVNSLKLTGVPDKDWRTVRHTLEAGPCRRLEEIANAVRDVRILERGTQLRQALSQDWRDNCGYRNALSISRQALVQEHFSMSSKPESGVIVMNMHKAKGKQFDEVIIFEGWPIIRKGQPPYNADRIVRFNSKEKINSQTRQNLRVSVTRGKLQTTILTPRTDPCVLLLRADE